jgi:hypothetical protein
MAIIQFEGGGIGQTSWRTIHYPRTEYPVLPCPKEQIWWTSISIEKKMGRGGGTLESLVRLKPFLVNAALTWPLHLEQYSFLKCRVVLRYSLPLTKIRLQYDLLVIITENFALEHNTLVDVFHAH